MRRIFVPTVRVLLPVLSVLCFSCTVFAQNLLTNADFKKGTPGSDDFAWTVELAQDQPSECTVVQGRTEGSTALSIYHDELGASHVSQEIKVEPWRWYVAQVWVNSEAMAAFDFAPSVSLTGGRRISGGRFHNDAFEWPKKGWRRINVIAHAADQDHVTLKMGGGGVSGPAGGFSGELLFCEPVVRECSVVEAAGYYQTLNGRHPIHYGLPPDPENNRHGYAFQRGNVCRVAPGFPNPLYINGRYNAEAPEGRISLALPPGIRFRVHQDPKIHPPVSDMPRGFQRVELPLGAGGGHIVVDSDLAPGEDAVGYVQLEWQGGFQVPTPVHFKGITLPDVTAPKRAIMTLVIGGTTITHWNRDEEAMVRDIKRLGYNHVDIWGGALQKDGMHYVAAHNGTFYIDPEQNPEAVAVMLNGEPCLDRGALGSPSYRGPALQPLLDTVIAHAQTASALTIDDEFYACSAQSPTIGFHPRTIERWHQWVAEAHPDLAGVDPKVFARRPHRYRKHYDAWLDFRCELIAERYAIARDTFHKAVKESGAKTTERPMLSVYIGGGPLVGLHSNKALAPALDYVANMVYDDAAGLRKEVARLAPLTGKKLLMTLSPGYQISPPGDARSGALEALMGGSQGLIEWGYFMGMTTGQLADVADAVKMFTAVEDVILDGTIQDGYTSDSATTHLLARREGDVSALLVSDYSPNPGNCTVTVPGEGEVNVTDLFTDKVIARLDSKTRTFTVKLRRDFTARLYSLSSPR